MTNLLVISDDLVPAEARSRLESCYSIIDRGHRDRNLESYYQSVLEELTRAKGESAGSRITIVEAGRLLSKGPEKGESRVYLIEDIIGLMVQPACFTQDEQGHVQFTDVSQLFAPRLLDAAEAVLQQGRYGIRRCTAAAVAAPELLTPTESKVLAGMGAEVAVTYLYLEVRAARARDIPALGVVVPLHHVEAEKTGSPWIEMLCRLAEMS